MKLLGITGPTGAGKTTALHALEELGSAVIDCDAVYHRLLCEDQTLLSELQQRFGTQVFDAQGQLDRKALGNMVFGDANALQDLNTITHRYVAHEIDRLLIKAEQEGKVVAAIDAIALLESALKNRCQILVAVTAPAQVRVARIMAREGISIEYAQARVSAQKPDSYFRERCHYIFDNHYPDAKAAQAAAKELFQTILLKEDNSDE